MIKIPLLLVFWMTLFLTVKSTDFKSVPKDTTYTIYQTWLKAKKTYPGSKPASSDVPSNVSLLKDLVYTTLQDSIYPGRALHLDVFQSIPGNKKRPVVILIHGGGWRSGDKKMQWPLAVRLAGKGFVAVTVEYQLSAEATFPQPVYNIKSAIRWLKSQADMFSIDTMRMAISGSSAGGQLATLVGMTNSNERFEGSQGNNATGSSVQAIIDMDGVLDFMAPNSLNLKRRPDSPDIQWLGGSFVENPSNWRDASPIFWLKKDSPPVLFLNSGISRFHAGQDEMIAMMDELGVYHDQFKFDVQIHPFWLLDPWIDPVADKIAAFLTKVFAL